MNIGFTLLILQILHISVANDITCPDGKTQCDLSMTCCKISNGNYTCCSKQAVCNGQDVCSKLNNTLSDALKNDTICPGGKYTCPENSTCCKHSHSEIYACCLLPYAVCCDDGESCCPQSSKCDLITGHCINEKFRMYNA